MESAKKQVGIGHCQRSTFSITSGPRVGTGRLGPNFEHFVLVRENGTTTGSHRVDIKLRRRDDDPGGGRLEDVFVLSTET